MIATRLVKAIHQKLFTHACMRTHALELSVCQDTDEPGLSEQLKTQMCNNIAIYAQKYDEAFAPHLPKFVTAVWNLLIVVGPHVKYDLVSPACILHVTFVVAYP